ncbi:MAG: class I SAM-dependent methyltransferase [Promethearchaeota archaeon]
MNEPCYNGFAKDYDNKRKNPWVPLKIFLEDLDRQDHKFNGILIDLGCGNGRNLPLFKNSNNIILGIDNSLKFLQLAKNRNELRDLNAHFLLGNMLALPIRPNSINSIFSIASIHHVMNKSERSLVLEFLSSILVENGYIVMSVWRKFQKKYRNYFLFEFIKQKLSVKYKKKQEALGLHEFGDILIPWTVSSKQITYNRYYHLFSKIEFKRLLVEFKILKLSKLGGPNRKDNYFILARKNKKFIHRGK